MNKPFSVVIKDAGNFVTITETRATSQNLTTTTNVAYDNTVKEFSFAKAAVVRLDYEKAPGAYAQLTIICSNSLAPVEFEYAAELLDPVYAQLKSLLAIA